MGPVVSCSCSFLFFVFLSSNQSGSVLYSRVPQHRESHPALQQLTTHNTQYTEQQMVADEILAAAVDRDAIRFKNPHWKMPNKRRKPQRQLISDEQKRLNSIPDLPVDAVTYFSVDAYPSLKPKKHYCDITGFAAKYKVPSNGLRFYNSEVYDVIKHMSQGVDQQYLELRNANVVLK